MAIKERFYTVSEVSALLNASGDKVRKLFRDRPGVMRLSHTSRPRLRIPESLLKAVMAEYGYRPPETESVENDQETTTDARRHPANQVSAAPARG